MGKVASMWVLTLAFASIISSSMYGVLVAVFHPMSKPLSCGFVQNQLAQVGQVYSGLDSGLQQAYNDSTDMEEMFARLDSNGDDKLDSAELESNCPPLNMLRNSNDVTVEAFGRRRRAAEDMDKDDFLRYTCMSADKLDHMENTECQPQCRPGYVADNTLKCKLAEDSETDEGGFILHTEYSGFTQCVPHQLEC